MCVCVLSYTVFHCITILLCGLTCRTLEGEIKTRPILP